MLRHLGEVSRFDMLWTFMAASPGYTVFTGLVELLAALLLFWRATAVLGALLAAAAMTNVVALDLAFDLRGPLLIAMLLLVLSIIVLAPHLRALGSFLVVSSTDRMVRPVGTVGNDRPRIWTVVNMIAVVCLLAMQVQSRVTQREAMFAGRPLYGLWDVESIPPDDPARQTGLADSSAWRRVGSGGRNRDNGLFVELVSGDVRYFGLVDDGTQRTWTLRQRNEEVAVLHYQLEPGGAVLLDGRIGKVPVKMRLRGVDPARVQLLDLR
jgi:hypothetical protein